jgi:ABC-type nitrate/sulfonate/bicarbonate transport system substrate-binding protein
VVPIAAIAVVGLLAVPAVGTKPKTQSTSPESSSITVPITSVSAQLGPLNYVNQAGFFKKYGLDVTTPVINSAGITAAFSAGRPQIANLNVNDVLVLAAGGVGVTMIGCTTVQVPFQIYTKKEISKPADLEGKTVGVSTIGSITQISAELFLDKHGLKPADVQFIATGSVANSLAALEAGRVDAAVMSFPAHGTAAQDSSLHKLGDAPSRPSSTVVLSSWAKTNRNTILAYLRAYADGWASYNTNQRAALPTLAKFLNLNLDDATQAATVKQGYEVYKAPAVAPPAPCQLADATSYLKFLTPEQRAVLNRPKSLFDNEYVDALRQEGFYAKMKKKYGAVPGLPA